MRAPTPATSATAALPPQRLRVGDTVLVARAGRPAGPGPLPVLTHATPDLSWVVPLERDGQTQTGYQVLAAEDADPRTATALWDSGPVASDQHVGVAWGGPALRPGPELVWTVRVRDERGAWSGWADPVRVAVPPLTAGDWRADWIEVPRTHAARCAFTVPGVVRRAVLHVAAQGVVRIGVDGGWVDAEGRDPTDTARHRVVSRSYDVTTRLTADGPHVLAVVAGLGRYRHSLPAPRLLAELVLELADGSSQRLGTSTSWRTGPTSLVLEDPFHVEAHDARVADGWIRPDWSDHGWTAAAPPSPTRLRPLPTVVEPDAGPPVRVVAERSAVRLADPTPGTAVFDVGDNVAARSRLELTGTHRGQVLTLTHGELLGPDGRVDTGNLTMPSDRDQPRQVLRWTCAGGDRERVEAWFSVHGFRYLEVTGLERAEVVGAVARVLHSDVEQTGVLASSEPVLDTLVQRAVRTQLNNLHGYPEDCPTREQGGWTGDAAVSAEAALAHLDLAGVYRNWLADVVGDQRADGGILGVSPQVDDAVLQPADPVWGAALSEICRQLLRHTGGARALLRFLPALRRWADWQLGTLGPDGVCRAADISYGADWLALEETPPVLLQTAAVVRSLQAVAEVEDATGSAGAAARRREQAAAVRAAARRVLWDPTTATWGNGSQAATALALTSGLAEPAEVPQLRARLVDSVLAAGGRLRSGYAGTQALVRALADLDGGSLLLQALRTPDEPGVGAMLVSGPGTLWETWWLRHPVLGTASLDHIGLAAPFAAWAWTHVVGLQPLQPGFDTFLLAPALSAAVPRLRATVLTVHGEIAVAYQRHGPELQLQLDVPVGSRAVVRLPPHRGLTLDEVAIQPDPATRGGTGPGTGGTGTVGVSLTSGRHRLLVSGITDAAPRLPGPPRRPREVLWLSGRSDLAGWGAAPGDRVQRLREPWVCTPVHHRCVDGDVLRVGFSALPRDQERWISLPVPAGAAPAGARYLFVEVDLDAAGLPGRRVTPLLRARLSDGTDLVGSARWLPVSWTRVAVDLGADDGARVRAVDVGLRWSADHDPARGPDQPPPPHPVDLTWMVARVGYGLDRRTW